MDILFINPYSSEASGINEATVEIPLGLAYLASYLEKEDFVCGIIDANVLRSTTSQVVKRVAGFSPGIVGISINAFTFCKGLEYARQIKQEMPAITVILGGPQATVAPEICLEEPQIDAVVYGEGELTLAEIMNNYRRNLPPFDNVRGIVYKKDGEIVRNAPRERIENPDALPFPAYHHLPGFKKYKTRARRNPFVGIITSRGCPQRCIFCSKDVFGSKITLRSPANVIAEIDYLVKTYGVKQIDILDDNFTINRQRCLEICNLIIERKYELLINLQSGVRADRLDEELIGCLKKAGVFKIAIGVESGSPEILRNIRKNMDLRQVLDVTKWARKEGMIVVGFFMIGLPGDTSETMQQTIDFAIKMNPHIANFMMTIPFYGTELYNQIVREGNLLVDTRNGIGGGFYSGEAYYEIGGLTGDRMVCYYNKAYRRFYLRLNKIVDIISTLRSGGELKWFLMTAWDIVSPKRYK